MCNSRPVVRLGRKLDFRLAGHSGEKDGESEHSLSKTDALAIGYKIHDSSNEISDQIASGVSKVLAARDFKAVEIDALRADDARISFAHGIVVDLPNSTFETENFHHRIRCCITVCQNGSRSKLWFRSQCEQIIREGKWVSPVEMSLDEISAFMCEAEELGELALDENLEIYKQIIGTQLAVNATDIDLVIGSKFAFKTFDSDRDDLPLLYENVLRGDSYIETLRSYVSDHSGTSVHPSVIAAIIGGGKDGFDESKSDLKSFLDNIKADDEYSVIGHPSFRDEAGILLKRASVVNNTRVESFSGVTYDPEARLPGKKLAQSPAYKIAADLLSQIANAPTAT